MRQDVTDLVQILKLMELKEPSAYLIPLLHLVSDHRFEHYDLFNPVEMICPFRPEPHFVHAHDFVLLEEVEAALDSGARHQVN